MLSSRKGAVRARIRKPASWSHGQWVGTEGEKITRHKGKGLVLRPFVAEAWLRSLELKSGGVGGWLEDRGTKRRDGALERERWKEPDWVSPGRACLLRRRCGRGQEES